ncbi:hypothetical protein [Flavobacterium sp.]|uniref:hypothetical protein n=1 Tax=Flavobacterium sp. TaxID=239 RepID=UPI0032679B7F
MGPDLVGWVKLDDQYRSHPKLVNVGADGLALDISGMCYCAAYLTDGFIPDAMVSTLFPVRNLKSAVKALVNVGRWERDDTHCGYWIHDYLDYNPSHDKVTVDREKERAKKQAQRRNPDGTYGIVPRGQQRGQPEGHPPPVPSVPSSSRPVPPVVVTSVGSSSSVEWVLRDEEETPPWAVVEAERRLAVRPAGLPTIVSRRSWIRDVARDDVYPEHAELVALWLADDPSLHTETIAARIAPAKPESDSERYARITAAVFEARGEAS